MKFTILKLTAFAMLATASGVYASSDSDEPSSQSSLRGSFLSEEESAGWQQYHWWNHVPDHPNYVPPHGGPYYGPSRGGGDLSTCKTNCQCPQGGCDMRQCKQNCQCAGGQCDMSGCKTNCQCPAGGCDQSGCKSNCQCDGWQFGPCTRGSDIEDPVYGGPVYGQPRGGGDLSTCKTNCQCPQGGCDMSECKQNCQCAGGNCKMPECETNCQCPMGQCDMSGCKTNCQCPAGGCDQSGCKSNCQCDGWQFGSCMRGSDIVEAASDQSSFDENEEEYDSEDLDYEEDEELDEVAAFAQA